MQNRRSYKFYQTAEQYQLRNTTIQTGLMRHPLDILVRSDPYLMIEKTPSYKKLEPKTIVFADHFFKHRAPKEKEEISAQLRLDRHKGVNILIQQPNGELQTWDGFDIPEEYELDVEKFTPEFINRAAFEQHHLVQNKVVIVDYFVTNELLGMLGNFIDKMMMERLVAQPKAALTILSRSINRFFILSEFNDSVIKILAQQMLVPLEKFVELRVQSLAALIPTYEYIFSAFPRIEKVVSKEYISHELMDYLIEKYPGLRLFEFKTEANDQFRVRTLSSGKGCYISAITIEGKRANFENLESFRQMLKLSPHILQLTLNSADDFSSVFKDFPQGKYSWLTKLEIIDTVLTADALTALFAATPYLSVLTLRGIGIESAAFGSLRPLQLRYLSKIHLDIDLTETELESLIKAAPFLEEIELNTSQEMLKVLVKRLPKTMPQVKKLFLADLLEVKPEELLTVLPQLEELTASFLALEKLVMVENLHQYLPCLKKMNLDVSDVDVEALPKGPFSNVTECVVRGCGNLTTKSFKTLLMSMPALREIKFEQSFGQRSETIYGDELDYGLFGKLEKIALPPRFYIPDIKKLIEAAPALRTIEFQLRDERNIKYFKQLAPDQLAGIEEVILPSFPDEDASSILKALLRAGPNLKKIRLPEHLVISELELNHQELVQLKKLGISGSAVKQFTLPSQPVPVSQRSYPTLDNNFFDPRHKKNTYRYVRYFKDISPDRYRLRTWRPEIHTLKGYDQFKPDDFQPIKDVKTNYEKNTDYVFHPGQIEVGQASDGYVLLPSVHAQERVIDLVVKDVRGNVIDKALYQYSVAMKDKNGNEVKDENGEKVEIHYGLQRSAREQFHCVQFPPGLQAHSIHFQIAIPKKPVTIPPILINRMDSYRQFGKADTAPTDSFKSIEDFAKYIRDNKVGGCLHRVMAAYVEWKPLYQDVRIVINHGHALIEVNIDGVWSEPFDLGGYEANWENVPFQSESPFAPQPEFKAAMGIESKSTFSPGDDKRSVHVQPEFKIKEISQQDMADIQLPLLVEAPSDLHVQAFYIYLKKTYLVENIFVAHDPSVFNVTNVGMTQQGEVRENYTPFKLWLDRYIKNMDPKKQAAICIDMRAFSLKQIAQINDLLNGRIANEKLPPNIKLFLIDTPDKVNYPSDFRRLVSQKVSAPTPTESTLLPGMPVVDKDDKSVTEIDLFNSLYWQVPSIGVWQAEKTSTESEYSFRWRERELQHTVSQCIVFKNPPMGDPEFRQFLIKLKGLGQFEWADATTLLASEFYQKTGYAWKELVKNVSTHELTGEEKQPPYVLSEANMLKFIEDPTFIYSSKTKKMELQDSYLTVYKNKSIDIMCTPGFSSDALAQFLTAANTKNVAVRFFSPTGVAFPFQHLLDKAPPATVKEAKEAKHSPVNFQLSSDIYFETRKFLAENPKTVSMSLSCLQASELGYYSVIDKNMRENMLKQGKLIMKGYLSDIAKKLLAGEDVLLHGEIPSHLYEAITSLSLGTIEGERYKGKLTIIAAPKNAAFVKAVTGLTVAPTVIKAPDKKSLLEKMHPDINEFLEEKSLSEQISFAELERKVLNKKIQALRDILEFTGKDLIDAYVIDLQRSTDVQLGFTLNPWVMVEGVTAIGKTEFLKKVLPKKERVIYDVEEWLRAVPQKGENIILAFDEATFMLFNEMGEDFLERFHNLKDTPPRFYWQGIYHNLTPQHKALFAFNPKSYGAARSEKGLLSEHPVSISFDRLPDFYLRARLIVPILKEALPAEFKDHFVDISRSFIMVYRWLTSRSSSSEVLISGREIKLMANLFASKAKVNWSKESLITLADEVAYYVGRQTLNNSSHALREQFEKDFKSTNSTLDRGIVPANYSVEEYDAYFAFKNILDARQVILTRDAKSTLAPIELGLGGILIEGNAGLREFGFIEKVVADYKKTSNQTVYYIYSKFSFQQKEELLRRAFAEGALVVGVGLNEELWPNKMLNNFLMGRDENGHAAKKPGFLFLACQKPAWVGGLAEDDPALRRRLFKITPDWAASSERVEHEMETARMFALSGRDSASRADAKAVDLGGPKAGSSS